MSIKKLLAASGTTMIALALVAGPTFAAKINIEDNGSDSDNKVRIRNRYSRQYRQSNNTDIMNSIIITANTGNNKVEDNTGGDDGDVEVKSGDVTTTVSVGNVGPSNTNMADDCGCDDDGEELEITIKDNGSDSDNKVSVRNYNRKSRYQRNTSSFGNLFDFYFNTGDNKVEDNTGGESDVTSGEVVTDVVVVNDSSLNTQ